MDIHQKYMKKALQYAQKAYDKDEVPIGCVIVREGEIIARAYNTRQRSRNAVDHAEIRAIQKACKKLKDWRLNGCDLYVTLEPCAMCVGACVNARIENIYFGAFDEAAGCCGSVINLADSFRMNHTTVVKGGILQEECSQLIKDYFREKRKSSL